MAEAHRGLSRPSDARCHPAAFFKRFLLPRLAPEFFCLPNRERPDIPFFNSEIGSIIRIIGIRPAPTAPRLKLGGLAVTIFLRKLRNRGKFPGRNRRLPVRVLSMRA